jgi:hypothetical protein
MELPPTYARDVPYEQGTVTISVASEEARQREVVWHVGAASGMQAYRIYAEPEPNETPLFSMTPVPMEVRDEVADDTNAERLELLAQKYVGQQWSREHEARLQIDHLKVEQLYPRVTPEQVELVERVRQELGESGDRVSRMLDDLGIR